ncbi:MAG: uracil-DNA glycosylase [Candidatus Marinimicrobia bacterium]|nr:uracil-DNA glycosylase [Candidatus Neomarinimicrobiota bacterium]
MFRKECKLFPVCPLRSFYEDGNLDTKWIKSYCKGDCKYCIRYQMEESGEPHSDRMLLDGIISGKLKALYCKNLELEL